MLRRASISRSARRRTLCSATSWRAKDPQPDEEVEVSLRSQALARALGALTERERAVLVLRYGLDNSEPRTLEEIGRTLELTRERVRQIEGHALKRLARLQEIETVA